LSTKYQKNDILDAILWGIFTVYDVETF